jgi:hypothetical protein
MLMNRYSETFLCIRTFGKINDKFTILGFEIHRAEVMENSSISWDITPCNTSKVNRRFGETYRLKIQRRRISQSRNQDGAVSKQQKYWLSFNGQHGVLSQKRELYQFYPPLIFKSALTFNANERSHYSRNTAMSKCVIVFCSELSCSQQFRVCDLSFLFS